MELCSGFESTAVIDSTQGMNTGCVPKDRSMGEAMEQMASGMAEAMESMEEPAFQTSQMTPSESQNAFEQAFAPSATIPIRSTS